MKVRCVECKQKFDSKYDGFTVTSTIKQGDVVPNLMFCTRCGRRVSALVIETRQG